LSDDIAETEIAMVRSNEQMMDWLSAGKYAFGIGARDVDTAMMRGRRSVSSRPHPNIIRWVGVLQLPG